MRCCCVLTPFLHVEALAAAAAAVAAEQDASVSGSDGSRTARVESVDQARAKAVHDSIVAATNASEGACDDNNPLACDAADNDGSFVGGGGCFGDDGGFSNDRGDALDRGIHSQPFASLNGSSVRGEQEEEEAVASAAAHAAAERRNNGDDEAASNADASDQDAHNAVQDDAVAPTGSSGEEEEIAGEWNGRAFDVRVERIGFVDDKQTLRKWAKATTTREPRLAQDVDYFSGECSLEWLAGLGVQQVRVDTPSSAMQNRDKSFEVPEGYTLIHVASHLAVHVGIVAPANDVDRIVSAVRRHLNVSQHSLHFVRPLRFDAGSPTKSSRPGVVTIGNRETSFVSATAMRDALAAAGVLRVRVWSIGAKTKLTDAIAALQLDGDVAELLEWRDLFIDIGTLHGHDPRPVDGVLSDASVLGDAIRSSARSARDDGTDGLIPLFTKELGKYASSLAPGVLGKTRVTCNTSEFGDFARLDGAAGWLSIRPGSLLKNKSLPAVNVVKGSVYQVATGYGRAVSSMRAKLGNSADAVRGGLRALKHEMLPALREFTLGGFRTEIRFCFDQWASFAAAGGIVGLARSVNSLRKYLSIWKIDVPRRSLTRSTCDFVKLVDQSELLDLVEQRIDQMLAIGVSRLNKRNNSAQQQKAQLRELLSLLGIDTKWDNNLLKRRGTFSMRTVRDEEATRKRARFEAANRVQNTPVLVDKVISEAKNAVEQEEDDEKRKWMLAAFDVARLGGHKMGYALRRRVDKGGVWCGGHDIADVINKVYNMYSKWRRAGRRRPTTAEQYLRLMNANLQSDVEGCKIISNVSAAHLKRMDDKLN